MSRELLDWARRLQALAQSGLHFTKNEFEQDRYRQALEIAAEMFAAATDMPAGEYIEIVRRERGYATPKVGVRAAVFKDERILLVREWTDGRWALPGGWADVGQSPAECAAREVLEESGLLTRPVKLLAVYDRNKHVRDLFPFHVYKVFFLCEIEGGELETSNETTEVGFFGEDEIPELSAGRVTMGQVKRMFEHRRDPGLPADFD